MIMATAALGGIASTKVVAHRGFWKTDGSAQNSIAALVKADSIDCYGSEFDVWLSADGQLVVNHDNSFSGKKIEQTTFGELTSLKLSNGENLPSLEQYFDAAKKCKTRLILELKPHSDYKREAEAISKIVAMVKKYGYESTDADKAIETLAKRLKNIDDFPHEIGLFLGYPLGDVIGFIANAGKNSKCSGCWKVYCNECQAIKKFAQFEKCRRVYKEMWQKGKCVSQLAVAV